jgi:uncharacterized RDD family membrane protein YckC
MSAESGGFERGQVEGVATSEPSFAPIGRRYFAVVIDGLLVLATFIVVSAVMQRASGAFVWARAAIILGLFLVYEPVLTSRRCTVGQYLMGVRVRRATNLGRISVPAAYARIFVKWLLGIISFLTIPFNRTRRGLHDFACGSVVIDVRAG